MNCKLERKHAGAYRGYFSFTTIYRSLDIQYCTVIKDKQFTVMNCKINIQWPTVKFTAL